jgi:hypothetical protein
MLQVGDAQACIRPGLRRDGEFLRNVQEGSLRGTRCADIDPKDSPESAQVSQEIVRRSANLHVPKVMRKLEAYLTLPLATHPR